MENFKHYQFLKFESTSSGCHDNLINGYRTRRITSDASHVCAHLEISNLMTWESKNKSKFCLCIICFLLEICFTTQFRRIALVDIYIQKVGEYIVSRKITSFCSVYFFKSSCHFSASGNHYNIINDYHRITSDASLVRQSAYFESHDFQEV